MGTPKHLLQENGRTWLEQSVETLGKQVDRVVISGNGELPKSLQHLDRIPDVPGVEGPLAGILSVMRWAPSVSWLIAACDMPRLQREALKWLLDQRSPGVWAVLPDLHGTGRVEPLLAYYDFRSRLLLEEFAAQKQSKLNMLAENPRVRNSRPPVVLHESWKNINTLLDLERIT
jgi:molybdopterin-guanine dinucleotide biosynthesis protein A